MMSSIFSHMFIVNHVILFGEVSVQIFCSFFRLFTSLLLSFNSSLYILYNVLLFKRSLANIFSQSVSLVHSLDSVFTEQKFISLKHSDFIISLMNCASGVAQESLPNL